MPTWSRFQKIALIGLGAVGGGYVYYNLNCLSDGNHNKYSAYNSWTTNYTPSTRWDQNWDHRSPESLIKKTSQIKNEIDENNYNEKLEMAKSKSVRHLIMIRHGQYNIDKNTDKDRTLTTLGRLQADLTGKRLAALNIKYNLLVRSTMTRAQETGEIIGAHLDNAIPVKDCQLLEEGAPIPPEPPVGHWKPEKSQFFQDSARIEAAFRKYFHRAPPDQTEDTYTILVCHANVIRFFVCKALQFPPEGWLRISLNHGSITWISINPNGSVILRSLGDTGHMDPQYITSRNQSRRSKSSK